MREIMIYNVEGMPKKKDGVPAFLYSFMEMIKNDRYDMSQLERDRDVQERDNPIGWVIQQVTKDDKLIFVEIYVEEEFEFVKEKVCSGQCENCTCVH